MIYIYHDFGGTHTTILAASYHLKRLDETRPPTTEEILNSHNFNKLVYKDRGKLYFHGADDEGHKVFTMGRGRSKILIPGIQNVLQMLYDEEVLKESIILSNTSPTVPLAMTIGGMFSRALKIDFIGVPLLVMGAKQTYQNIINLVDHTRNTARNAASPLTSLQNKE